ncbi:MAG: hypothetical protein AAF657_39175 [Acidobacteriota bacterium]
MNILSCLGLLVLLGAVRATGAEPGVLTKAQWRQDGRQLAQLLREKHVDLFATVSEDDFNAAVVGFVEGVEEWNGRRIRVELIRLAALPSRGGRNGHTMIWPLQPALGFSLLEIKLYEFEEGLFVVDAVEPHRDLVGARVLRLGRSTTARVRASIAPLIARDGPPGLLRYVGTYSAIPDLLQALDHTASTDAVEVEVELASGATIRRAIHCVTPTEFLRRFATYTLLPGTDTRPFRATRLDDGVLYAKYNLVERRGPNGERFSRFVGDLRQLMRQQPSAPVVIDVRDNSGGNNRTYQPLLELLSQSAANARGELFALIGRGTFSAAGNFITDLEKRSNVVLIGEGTGGAPNQFGDARFHRLEHSAIEVAIPTVFWQKGGAGDQRLTHSPQVVAPPRAEDYFAGIDSALAAVRRQLASQ